MYDFAKKIGGDKVEVINLVPAGTEPHDWEPSTKDLIEMEKSDISRMITFSNDLTNLNKRLIRHFLA